MPEDGRVRLAILIVAWVVLVQVVRMDLVTGAVVYLWDVALIGAIWLSVRWGRQWWRARRPA